MSEKYEVCDCSFFEFEEDIAPIVKCGCGETHARLYRDYVIHWRGEHWRLECAFEKATKIISDLESNIDFYRRMQLLK